MGDPKLTAPLGNAASEASLQYETHATVRLLAKRAGKYAPDAQVIDEDKPEAASATYKTLRAIEVKKMLFENMDSHATDHSTIMTNGMHSEKALAYDVALGVCDIRNEDWRTLRMAADWRFSKGISYKASPHVKLSEYFSEGLYCELSLWEWAHRSTEGAMPEAIEDERDGAAYLALGKLR